MKRLAVVIFATLFAMSTFAQGRGGNKEKWHKHTPEQQAEKVASKLQDKLSLTDSQTVAVRTITLDAAQQKMAIKADTTLGKEARKEKIKAIRTETDSKIKAVLTPEQKTKYEEMKKENKEAREKNKEEGKVKNKKKKNKKKDKKVTPDENGKAGHRKNKE